MHPALSFIEKLHPSLRIKMEKSEVTHFVGWWPLSAKKVAFCQEDESGYPNSLPLLPFSLSKTIKLYIYSYIWLFTEVLLLLKMIMKQKRKTEALW